MEATPAPRRSFVAQNYKELLAAIVALPGFYLFTRFGVQAIDPTAGTTDFGIVDVIAFACAAVTAIWAFVWILLRIAFKTFHAYLDSKLFREEFFAKLTARDRIVITLGVLFFNAWLITVLARLAVGIK